MILSLCFLFSLSVHLIYLFYTFRSILLFFIIYLMLLWFSKFPKQINELKFLNSSSIPKPLFKTAFSIKLNFQTYPMSPLAHSTEIIISWVFTPFLCWFSYPDNHILNFQNTFTLCQFSTAILKCLSCNIIRSDVM